LYDVNEGQIKIDDNEISTLNLFDLRNSIGIARCLFIFRPRLKVTSSLARGREHGRSYCSKTQLHEKTSWALTSNMTPFWGKRNNIIRGQKQRVSIARAIKEPTNFTFDDCLSAVDTETEEAILNNLNKICKDKTTIIVSQSIVR
jgi:ATP-binding cassette subfamily B protein